MKAQRCPVCYGSGKVKNESCSTSSTDSLYKLCYGCNGKGWVEVSETNGSDMSKELKDKVPVMKKLREKIRNDYKGIISDKQIEATIEYWERLLTQEITQSNLDLLKIIESEMIGKNVTINDVVNFVLPNIYSDESKTKEELWGGIRYQNALRDKQRQKLQLLRNKLKKGELCSM